MVRRSAASCWLPAGRSSSEKQCLSPTRRDRSAATIARLLEHWIRFWLVEHHPLGTFLPHMVATFDWHRFIAVQLWILVIFFIYEVAAELNHLFGKGELWHLLVTSRPSELPLDRRQRILELVRLSKLADAHSIEEFRDPSTLAHTQLVDIVHRIAREPRERTSME